MRASVDTTALAATTTSSLAKAEALYTSKTVTVQLTNGCWLLVALLPVRTEPVGSVVVAKAVAARLDNGSGAAVLDVWKANWYVMGKSGSFQLLAAKTKDVLSAVPVDGRTAKLPGNGAPLVVTTMDARTLSLAQAKLNVNVARCGRAWAARTKLNVTVLLWVNTGKVRVEAVKADWVMLTPASSTSHEHVEVVEGTNVTEAARARRWLVATDTNDDGGVVMAMTGTGCADTVTVTVGVADRA